MRVELLPVHSLTPKDFPIWLNNMHILENAINGNLDDQNIKARGISGESIKEHTIELEHLVLNAIQFDQDYTFVTNSAAVDAASTGSKVFPGSSFVVPALNHVKSATVIVDYKWAATARGVFELYDETAKKVLGSSLLKVGGGSTVEWEEFTVSGLTAGNVVRMRVNISTAGAAGETVTLYKAILRLSIGIS